MRMLLQESIRFDGLFPRKRQKPRLEWILSFPSLITSTTQETTIPMRTLMWTPSIPDTSGKKTDSLSVPHPALEVCSFVNFHPFSYNKLQQLPLVVWVSYFYDLTSAHRDKHIFLTHFFSLFVNSVTSCGVRHLSPIHKQEPRSPWLTASKSRINPSSLPTCVI